MELAVEAAPDAARFLPSSPFLEARSATAAPPTSPSPPTCATPGVSPALFTVIPPSTAGSKRLRKTAVFVGSSRAGRWSAAHSRRVRITRRVIRMPKLYD